MTKEAADQGSEIPSQSYRCEEDSSDDDSSTSSDGSECSDSFLHKLQKNVNKIPTKPMNLKTKGELDLDELPPIQDLNINVDESEIKEVGKIDGIVDKLVTVRALRYLPPLDIDSVLFLTSQKPLGRIFDVFGPVSEPFYAVRFNSTEHIKEAGVKVGSKAFYAPKKDEITTYVFIDELKKQKGSDASWMDNNEPPEEFIDFSDDEQEKAAKHKRKAKNRTRPTENDAGLDETDQPVPVKKNVQVRRNTVVPPRSVNSFRSARSNSNHLSMAAVMSSDYRPPASRVENSYRGPPIYAQPHNTFGAPRSRRPLPNEFQPNQPPEVPFRASQPYVSQAQSFPLAPPTFSYPTPSQSPARFQPPPISPSLRFPPQFLQQTTYSKPVMQQRHAFGQMTPLGSMSPVLQETGRFPPLMTSPPPPISSSFSPHSPNLSFFGPRYISAPSPPAPIINNSSWFQDQSLNGPPVRFVTSMSPLTIQIPGNLRTPPPTLCVTAANGFNAVSAMPPPQNVGTLVFQQDPRQY